MKKVVIILFAVVFCLCNNLVYGQIRFNHLTINEGLTQNTVYCLLQDREGYIWLGTEDGLNRYDGYEFRQYRPTEKPNSISNGFITSMVEDSLGRIWVGTSDGLNVYDKKRDLFKRIEVVSEESKLSNKDFIKALLLVDDGVLVGTIEGLKKYSFRNNKVFNFSVSTRELDLENRIQLLHREGDQIWYTRSRNILLYDYSTGREMPLPVYMHLLGDKYVRTIKKDNFGNLWFGTESDGVFVYNPRHEKLENIILPGVAVRDIYFRSASETWIGTIQGLVVIQGDNMKRYIYKPEQKEGLSYNSVRCILKDYAGNMWLGTYAGGVNIVYNYQHPFHLIKDSDISGQGLGYPVVSSLYEEQNASLWIGTEGGGLNYYDKESNQFETFLVNSSKNWVDNIVKSLEKKDENHLWVGTGNGLKLFDTKQKKFVPHDVNIRSGLSIYALKKTDKGLWIGTNGDGLIFYDNHKQVHQFVYSPWNSSTVNSNNIYTLVSDGAKLWIGTRKGLMLMDTETFEFKEIRLNNDNDNNPTVMSVWIDRKSTIWAGTNGQGLYYIRGNVVGHVADLSHEIIRSLNEDAEGNLWIATNKGISKLYGSDEDQNSPKLVTYNVFDGLQSNQFSTNATLRSLDGQLYFGGIKGISHFYPDQIKSNTVIPKLVFTDILVRDKRIEELQEISADQEIKLEYNYGSITIRFAALNYLNANKNQYAYRMVGLRNDDDWHYVDANQRIATYSNLNPGTYYFDMKGSNNDGLWNEDFKRIKIVVNPPFWKTWWAYCLYALFTLCILYVFYYYTIKTIKLQNSLEFEQKSHEKNRELAQQKLDFFTNISHEIKTPLTLILTPLEKVLKGISETNKFRSDLEVAHKNVKTLSRLIHQLLDIRKLEAGVLKLDMQEGDLVGFIAEQCALFRQYANSRNIHIIFEKSGQEMNIFFDKDKLERVLANLLSNAIKFSEPDSKVYVRLQLMDERYFKIEVQDFGTGISEEMLPKIFDKFSTSSQGNNAIEGTGLGLAFAKGLVELMGGNIYVESKEQTDTSPGNTKFILILPCVDERVYTEEQYSAKKKNPLSPNRDNGTILIVEDNTDMLHFMDSILSPFFTVLKAADGLTGIDMALKMNIDLIISDVMMPRMNGLELCKVIKTNVQTKHIPVILLTARSATIDKMEGLEYGADDYLTKPFNTDELLIRARNLIRSHKEMSQKIKTELASEPLNTNIDSAEEIFLSKVMRYIEEHIANPELNVEELASVIGLSRGAFYRKIKSITGLTAVEFLRTTRIKRAGQILKDKNVNVSEVAYMVGFVDVDYFRKYFKMYFGQTPKEYLNNQKGTI